MLGSRLSQNFCKYETKERLVYPNWTTRMAFVCLFSHTLVFSYREKALRKSTNNLFQAAENFYFEDIW